MPKEKFVIVKERIKIFFSNEFGTKKIMGDLKTIIWYLTLSRKLLSLPLFLMVCFKLNL